MVAPALAVRLAVAGACGVLLAGGIVAALTVEEDPPASLGVVDGSTESSSPAQPTDPPEEAPATVPTGPAPAAGGPATGPVDPLPAAPGTTATTRAGRATTSTTVRTRATAAPGPLVAPKVGSYGYDATTASGGAVPSTSRATVTVDAAGSEGVDTLQDITIPTDQLGQRTSIRSRVAWGPAGAIVRRSQAAGGDCGWQPPWPQYEGDLRVGKAWSYDTRCSVTTPVQATIERRGSRRVTGSMALDVAGRPVATWTLAVDETTVITSIFGVISVRSTGTEQLAPSLGLPVAKAEALSGTGVAPGSTSTLTLVSLP